MASAQVALLRGVNVGGKNKLPIRDLARMFEEVGCANVRTFVQSGNVVFTAGAGVSQKLASLIARLMGEVLEPLTRIELVTSSLPRTRSTN